MINLFNKKAVKDAKLAHEVSQIQSPADDYFNAHAKELPKRELTEEQKKEILQWEAYYEQRRKTCLLWENKEYDDLEVWAAVLD